MVAIEGARRPLELALFDLDNTLLSGDSDYEWAQFLIERGVLQRAEYEAKNERFSRQYKAGRLDIHEFLDFQLAPLARYPRAKLEDWHGEFMQAKVKPLIRPKAMKLVQRHLGEWLVGRGQTLASFSSSWFYSDSLNDLPLLERVTHPVAVDPDETLRREALARGWRIISLE